ncbi:MAG TPA: tetratricopeptide repeat protein, partial [Trueperaceae bacterium]|nr:tetratricopeptide repeat protein [Trueperaceae bacterium]
RNLEEALSVGRATRATRVEGAALNALAVLAGQQDDQAGAERYNLESLALAKRQGQLDDQRAALSNLGGVLNGQSRLHEAALYLRRALELAQRSGNPGGLNQTYSLLAENCSLRGDHSGAAAYFRSALDPGVLSGTSPFGEAQCLALLANVFDRSGRANQARALRLELIAQAATVPALRHRLEERLAGAVNDEARGHGSGVGQGAGPTAQSVRSLAELAAAQLQALKR